jgi:serine/threonine protein phosphatase PrpC
MYGILQLAQFLAIVLCMVVTVVRSMTRNAHPLVAKSVAGSAALGSFLSGLFAAMPSDSHENGLLIVIGACIAVAAFAVLGIVIIFVGGEKQQEESQKLKRAVVTPRNSPIPQSFSTPENMQVPKPDLSVEIRLPTGPSQKPLFEDDPLYMLPQPHQVRFFMEVKDSGSSVLSEDACAISPDEMRFALCDGVSTSNFSRSWAAALAQRWVEEPLTKFDPEIIDQWLEKPRKRWLSWVYDTWLPTINKRNHSEGYKEFSHQEAVQLADEGAAATFLGVIINREVSSWFAIAVGDTCLFHLSAAENHASAFPLSSSAEFTDLPHIIYSRAEHSLVLSRRIKSKSQNYNSGDVLLLATDALAEWLLKKIEENDPDWWQSLLYLTTNQEFVALVHQERANKRMKNDDATLVIVYL